MFRKKGESFVGDQTTNIISWGSTERGKGVGKQADFI